MCMYTNKTDLPSEVKQWGLNDAETQQQSTAKGLGVDPSVGGRQLRGRQQLIQRGGWYSLNALIKGEKANK